MWGAVAMTHLSKTTLVVDADQPRSARAQAPVDVAVGLLLHSDGRFLLCTRPPGKAYAGYWEFPGGKVEQGEDVLTALGRELAEEIGIHVQQATLWQVLVVDYPHALVRLHFCKVLAWSGDITMLEGQQHAWQTHPVQVAPILPGTVPVLAWLASES
jgi:8-oxo-dGTP diphosphatase